MTVKVLTLDIETSPLQAYVWGLFDQTVGLNQIKEEWCILSYAAKWLGNDEVIYRDNSRQRNKEDDRRLVKDLWNLLDKADIVIGQNAKRFDVRKINARFLLLGYPPPSPYKIIDTMVEARRHFALTSNRLEWLSDKLTPTKKEKHKKFPGFELWKECLAGNPEAWAEMREYNIPDTVATEQLYLRLRPWITGHPNLGTHGDQEEGMVCPNCGGTHVIRKGTRTTQVGVYARYRCQECGAWSRGRQMLNTKEQRRTLLTN